MTDHRPPRDNLVRALPDAFTVSEDGKTLFGRIAPADVWAEIRSSVEGHFMERNAPGAFRKTFAERTPKILFQHGKDPQLGNQIIAEPREVGEDTVDAPAGPGKPGGFYKAEILDGVPPLIVEGLKRGLYGSSHTFGVVRESWNDKPARSASNPNGLPERTIIEARVDELGPVTWPAYADAIAGVRSLTDEFTLNRLSDDPEHLREIVTYVEPAAPSVEAGDEPHLETERREEPEPPPDEPAPTVIPNDPPEGGSSDSRKESPVAEYISREDKVARVSELKAEISRQAVESPGEFAPDVQAVWDANNAELDKLERDIAAWDSRQARIAALSGDAQHVERTYEPVVVKRTLSAEDIHDLGKIRNETRSREEYDAKVRENALRSIDGARFARNANPDSLVDIIENRDSGDDGDGEIARRVLLTGAPAYRRYFTKYLRNETALATSEESRAAALAVTGTTTTGGYAVPYVFDPTIIHVGVYTAQNPFRQACRVETITNGNNWRTVTVGAVTTAYITEAGAATEQGPTFAQPSYTVQAAHAFATVSHETLQDRPDIGAELGSVFAESKATYEENQFAVGVGTTVFPLGMFTDTAYTNQDTVTNDVTALVDFTTVEGALPLRFRANAAWFMARSTIRQLQILDTTYRYFSGAQIQFPGPGGVGLLTQGSSSGGNTGLQLLGYPIWEVPSAVSTLTTDGAIIAVLCDPKSYIIVDRLGMSIEVIPNMLNGATPSFPTGQRGIYARFRNTAKPITADAGRSLSVQ